MDTDVDAHDRDLDSRRETRGARRSSNRGGGPEASGRARLAAASPPPTRQELHDLCHTRATVALQAGVHPKVVQEHLGHSTIAITLDIYSHVIPVMQEEAAAMIARPVIAGE